MLSTSIRRAFAQSNPHILSLPPTFLLPLRARLSTTPNTTGANPPENAFHTNHLPPKASNPETNPPTPQPSPPKPPPPSQQPPPATAAAAAANHHPPTLLPLLAAQPPHYIIAHLHGRPYLLTEGDLLRLPFHMPHAIPGTLLRLTRASSLGSREYTYRGSPWVDERDFVCRARVVGVEGEPMRVVEKTKRRQRHTKTVRSKMRFTVLRVVEVRVRIGGDGEGGRRGRSEEGEE